LLVGGARSVDSVAMFAGTRLLDPRISI
jgi:hypothetical protein